LIGTVRADATLELARKICSYKSGKYTVERPLHLGAALAGRLAEMEVPLSAYGEPLGEAFQLRDDLLGVFGDEIVTGKPVGEDVRDGKPTTLFALARNAATGDDAALLCDRYGAPGLTAEDISGIQAVFERTGARAATESRVESLVDEALSALGQAPISSVARDELAALARFVGERDF
ncbi:MAG: geranylgeranyl diphosphate synthase, type, partial [Actinomycetota bacterium]|jgi:geranylgeranyl diphosphate synthase type I